MGRNMDTKNLDDLIKKIPPDIKYYGVWNNDGTWRDFRRGHRIFEFDPVYGHRSKKSSAVLYNRGKTEKYLYVIDSDGFVPNSLESKPALTRLREARNNGQKVIFLFGASTVFGTGSVTPDENISAFLEKHLNAGKKNGYIVINAGVGGYTTDNQLRYLMCEIIPLKPDIVVFYDGWADCDYLNGLITTHRDKYIQGRTRQSYSALKREESLLYFKPTFEYAMNLGLRLIVEYITIIPYVRVRVLYILRKIFPKMFSHPLAADITNISFHLRAVEIYAYNIFIASILCQSFNIKFLHFLQPLLSTGPKIMTEREKALLDKNVSSSGDVDVYINFYRHFEERNFENAPLLEKVDTYSLRNIFQDVSQEVYVDTGHLNARGNNLVAKAIADVIKG